MHFTSCKACNEILQVTYTGQESHPGCPQTAGEIAARAFVDAIQRGDQREAERLEVAVNKVDEPPSLGSAALWYAEVAKWPVFPLRPGEKVPACRHGLKEASLDSDQVRRWWSENPAYNIGGLSGHLWDVIDIDGQIGFESVAALDPSVFPDIHGRANTPRGQHWYTKVSGDGNRAAVRPGLDFRGRSGYVLLPPSVIDGKRYSWAMKPSPEIMG